MASLSRTFAGGLARSALARSSVLFACACGSPQVMPPVAVTTATPAEEHAPRNTAVQDAAKKEAAIEALTEQEAKSGACDPAHQAALEKLLGSIEIAMKSRAGEGGKALEIQTVEKQIVALSSRSRSIRLTVSGRGTELDVFVLGVRDVTLDVLANGTPSTTMRSPFQATLTAASPPTIELPTIAGPIELRSDSRQVQITPGQPLELRLGGQGCAIAAAFRKP